MSQLPAVWRTSIRSTAQRRLQAGAVPSYSAQRRNKCLQSKLAAKVSAAYRPHGEGQRPGEDRAFARTVWSGPHRRPVACEECPLHN